ncbi:Lumazine-binding domain [Dillenia turbinata]|uniref:Lumazine-binding domain n=1 Tax=Dillenia turbinata TaxID=194707 RepID=A0AAN8VUF8_9MAGN
MGGHFVQGHVDGVGVIESREPEGDSLWIKVKTSPEILKYIVTKGYIAVDGTSLTVVKVFDVENCFNFMLVAYTQQKVCCSFEESWNEGELGGFQDCWARMVKTAFIGCLNYFEKRHGRDIAAIDIVVITKFDYTVKAE